eukprot:15473777-Alexandrium_andersonii.AAC.1
MGGMPRPALASVGRSRTRWPARRSPMVGRPAGCGRLAQGDLQCDALFGRPLTTDPLVTSSTAEGPTATKAGRLLGFWSSARLADDLGVP